MIQAKLALALASVVMTLASGALGVWYGWSERSEKAALDEAALVAQADSTRIELARAAAHLSDQLHKEREDARKANDRYHDAVRAGAVRLSIATTGRIDRTPATATRPGEARAELDPAAALRIDRIANDGDAAIQDLNACIDLYEEARSKLNGER